MGSRPVCGEPPRSIRGVITMTQYAAPLRDIRFVREELLDIHSTYEALPGYERL